MRTTFFSGLFMLASVALPPGAGQAGDSAPSAGLPDVASPREAAKEVDRLLAEDVFAGTSPADLAPRTNSEAFLRRVSLDLVGRLPLPGEVTTFVLDPDPAKREALVERLLNDRDFGTNWARYWRDVILSRRVEDRALLVSQPLEQFLADQFNRNIGWNQTAAEFLTAEGVVSEHGQTGLILAQMADANDVASEASRIFMGVQIQCAQCHDHPTDRWKRKQFHEFAAFFPRASARPIFVEGRIRGIEITSVDVAPRFRRPGQPGQGSLEHYMPDLKDPSSQGEAMAPVFFVTGQKLSPGTRDVMRRESLAMWMTSPENEWFAKAFVNRMWAELAGEGFYEPVDDLGPDRRCSAPKTMQYLADQFAAHKYDVKWLMRTILATEAYQRESRPRRNAEQTPFLANCTQPLRADQAFDVLTTALQIDSALMASRPMRGAGFPGLGFGPRFQFAQTFGFDPSERRDEVTATIPQALMLMNSSMVNGALSASNAQVMLGRLLDENSNDEDAVVELYLRCLAREPSDAEIKVCLEHATTVGNRAEAFEDLAWSLVNSTEFLRRN